MHSMWWNAEIFSECRNRVLVRVFSGNYPKCYSLKQVTLIKRYNLKQFIFIRFAPIFPSATVLFPVEMVFKEGIYTYLFHEAFFHTLLHF